MFLGEHPLASPLDPRSDADPLEALARAVVPALEESRCFVSFSGGRDSSVVLAVATKAARKLALPPPIPITLRFPNDPSADETRWQELVVRRLRLPDWIRREVGDEIDFVGPIAADSLRRHGVLFPANAYVHSPIIDIAAGASLLTGFDGDGLFSGWRWLRVADVLSGRSAPELRDAARIALAGAPPALQAAVLARREPLPAWLRPDARRLAAATIARERADEPVLWRRRVSWWARRRYHHMARWSLDQLASTRRTQLVHPLLDPAFLAAVAARGGLLGFGDRTAAMRALFSGVLPDEVLSRAGKASFDRAFWGSHSRRFAESWNGRGVDTDLVDAEALRDAWRSESPDTRSALLLQSTWLAEERCRGREAASA